MKKLRIKLFAPLLCVGLLMQSACNDEDLRTFQTTVHVIIKGGDSLKTAAVQMRSTEPPMISKESGIKLLDVALLMVEPPTKALIALDAELRAQGQKGNDFKLSPTTKAAFVVAAEDLDAALGAYTVQGSTDAVARIDSRLTGLKVQSEQFVKIAKSLRLSDARLTRGQVSELQVMLSGLSDYQKLIKELEGEKEIWAALN